MNKRQARLKDRINALNEECLDIRQKLSETEEERDLFRQLEPDTVKIGKLNDQVVHFQTKAAGLESKVANLNKLLCKVSGFCDDSFIYCLFF